MKKIRKSTVALASVFTMVFTAILMTVSVRATRAAEVSATQPSLAQSQTATFQTTTTQATIARTATTKAQTTQAQTTTAKPTTANPTTQPAQAQPPEPAAIAPATTQGNAKTLGELYGDLSASTRGYEAIQARISGNVLTIDVYVNFKGAYDTTLGGATRAALAKQGFRLWAGTYKGSGYDFEPGISFTVQIVIHDIYDGLGALENQHYFDFVCLTACGYSFTFYGEGYYNRELLGLYDGAIPDRSYTNGTIGMYRGISGNYTANQYIKVAAHEFGHVLGLGDLHGKGVAPTQECPQGRHYEHGDMMGSHGEVTSNNIEMMLEAYTTGWYQAYVNSGPEVKSKVIRSY